MPGIAHLHEGISPSIIHRDIKPSNILIGEGYEAKVSDFGLVRSGPVGDQSHVSSQVKGTPGYLDPAYCSSFHLTPFTDVYSFGVILLQLVAARPAVESSRNNASSHIIDWARPSIEKDSIEDILDTDHSNTRMQHANDAKDGATCTKMCGQSAQEKAYNDSSVARTRGSSKIGR
ncbi:UNVERIFIED_CONTAM: putative serine/threonine-protein kinase PBL16 [Sesamum radiatum]|uniref:Serine/threonine-protein kinase PBL16 n=1 Tax=Sesamum radiatum TaxID=300843 RepID=A0AAW2L837_SESRA